MMRIASSVQTNLLFAQKYNFSKMLFNSSANPIKQRVMSTPTWPVPYYQRVVKAYPIREQKNVNLTLMDYCADDSNWLSAKTILSQTLKGRQIVQFTENNVKTNTYLIKKDCCESMAKAYVSDIGQFLDIANRQNVKILAGKTMI